MRHFSHRRKHTACSSRDSFAYSESRHDSYPQFPRSSLETRSLQARSHRQKRNDCARVSLCSQLPCPTPFTVKLAHAAVHNALAGSSHFWNGLLSIFFIEIWGGFTVEGSYEAHIQFHHPYTNVIGLGDSSSWRVPFLGRNTYLFIAPLFLQLLYPVVGLKLLAGRWQSKARFLFVTMIGYIMHFCLFHYVTGLSVVGAIFCNITVRTSTSTFLNTLVYLCAMSKSVPRDCTRWHHQRLVFPVISYLISPLVNQ